MEEIKQWIGEDESAKEMLSRVLTSRLFLFLPPLRKVSMRTGDVIELVGPSPSGKTRILMQTAISCILPKEWKGVEYGGSEGLVMFIDLDCRFDISCLSEMLRNRIVESNRRKEMDANARKLFMEEKGNMTYDQELFSLCLSRFIYVRCYDSLEFLATLKTIHHQVQKQMDAHGLCVKFLMIDSIGAFHWVDRASTSSRLVSRGLNCFSLQDVGQTVVQEIKKLLLHHPLIVIATKATLLGDRHPENELNRVKCHGDQLFHREYMPYVWQVM